MNNGIDSDAEVKRSTSLTEIDRLQSDADAHILELQRATRLALIRARRLLLAAYAFNGRIFVENPQGLDVSSEPSQSPAESDQ